MSFSTAKNPVGLSLADEYQAHFTTPPEKRSQPQKDILSAYFRKIDPGLRDRQGALAEAQKPLPVDPKLQELQTTLKDVSRPVGEDERLVQLRNDAKMSEQQLTNRRLTAAQDVAWALINSPAFLFNH